MFRPKVYSHFKSKAEKVYKTKMYLQGLYRSILALLTANGVKS